MTPEPDPEPPTPTKIKAKFQIYNDDNSTLTFSMKLNGSNVITGTAVPAGQYMEYDPTNGLDSGDVIKAYYSDYVQSADLTVGAYMEGKTYRTTFTSTNLFSNWQEVI